MALHPLLDHPALRYLREDVTLLDAEGRILGTTMEHDVTIGYAPDVWQNAPFFAFLDPATRPRSGGNGRTSSADRGRPERARCDSALPTGCRASSNST